jgi:exonuclease SbcD
MMIPGNHDNPDRLDFLSGMVSKQGVHIRCRYDVCDVPLVIEDGEDRVQVFCLPFVDDAEVKALHPDQGIQDHSSATYSLLSRIRERMVEGVPSILVAHEYTGRDVITSESERELLLGDQGRLPSDLFSGFDYVALGHLHGPQTASAEHNAVYSGSILQYSFSEWRHEKGYMSIEVKGGRISWQKVNIQPLRKMVLIEDTLDNVLHDPSYDIHRNDYVGVRLTQTGPRFDIQTKLRERFQNLLETTIVQQTPEGPSSEQVRQAMDSPRELFMLFLDKFGWVDPDRRDRALELFDAAWANSERSYRRGVSD